MKKDFFTQPGTANAAASVSSSKDDDVTDSEILWCLHIVDKYHSMHSEEQTVPLFQRMFKDSAIPDRMKLHEDKMAYVLKYGIAPKKLNKKRL